MSFLLNSQFHLFQFAKFFVLISFRFYVLRGFISALVLLLVEVDVHKFAIGDFLIIYFRFRVDAFLFLGCFRRLQGAQLDFLVRQLETELNSR